MSLELVYSYCNPSLSCFLDVYSVSLVVTGEEACY